MRYRKLDQNGDYSMGHGLSDWLVNTPATVGQAVKTRMSLFAGEWFANVNDGLPLQAILGFGNLLQCDYAVTQVISNTPGFMDFANYQSYYNQSSRTFMPTATIDTIYGQTPYVGGIQI